MHPVLRLFGIIIVFCVATVAWIWLGASTKSRNDEQSTTLRGAVMELWGQEQSQRAPTFRFEYKTLHDEVSVETVEGVSKEVRRTVTKAVNEEQSPRSTDLAVHLNLDQRRKGLVWYALYDVNFQGTWTYKHEHEHAGTLRLLFKFPDAAGLYDDFRFCGQRRRPGPSPAAGERRRRQRGAHQPG